MRLCVRRRTLPMTSIRPNHLRATGSRKNFDLRPALVSRSAPPQHAPPCTPLHTSGTYEGRRVVLRQRPICFRPRAGPTTQIRHGGGTRILAPGAGQVSSRTYFELATKIAQRWIGQEMEQRVPCAFWTPARWACLVIEGVQKLAQFQTSCSSCFCAATESLLLNYPEPAPILALIVSA